MKDINKLWNSISLDFFKAFIRYLCDSRNVECSAFPVKAKYVHVYCENHPKKIWILFRLVHIGDF